MLLATPVPAPRALALPRLRVRLDLRHLAIGVLLLLAVPAAGSSLGALADVPGPLAATGKGNGPRREVPSEPPAPGRGKGAGPRDDAQGDKGDKGGKKADPDKARPAPPRKRGALPTGKGMWIYEPDKAEGGNVAALVQRAKAVGLTHIYVRTGSSRMGFHGGPYLDQVLPAAHAAGIRVYGWDFPYLHDPGADVLRAVAAISHTAPGGHRIDGFVPDIETSSEGTNLTAANVHAYSTWLRDSVGPDYPLIACVPRPSPYMMQTYPYAAMLGPYDAVAPMVYWLNRQPDSDAAGAVAFFRRLGKPVIPIGQAYDGAPEGGRPGPPPRDEILRFLAASEAQGASGASFWSWQHASQEIWDAVRDAGQFRLPAGAPAKLRPADVRAVQTLLTSLGYHAPGDGTWGEKTTAAVRAYQADANLPVTGVFDKATRAMSLRPFAPPTGPAVPLPAVVPPAVPPVVLPPAPKPKPKPVRRPVVPKLRGLEEPAVPDAPAGGRRRAAVPQLGVLDG